jgi:uncharacterized protein (TIGR03790 family)
MKSFFLTLFVLASSVVFGQSIDYTDVAVIVNDNSPTSISIGDYFQNARNIPNENIIHVSAPTTDDIDSLQFELIRAQIEDYLIANDLVNSINYLVTTKGLPLRIDSECVASTNIDKSCASFDSELTLILGTFSNKIGLNGSTSNPIYNATQHFSKANSGIYLVTRLDGYTAQDVFSLIDRSGPLTGINPLSSQAIVDMNVSTIGDTSFFLNFYLQPTYNYLVSNNWNALLETDNSTPVTNQQNVFSYVYGGNGPLSDISLNYTWTNGSIGSMSTCSSAYTFNNSLNPQNFILIADLIKEGCTGAYGNVDCIYFSQLLNTEILHNRYLDPINNYNLAESFYMSEPNLSWQAVIVGDPKTSVLSNSTATLDVTEMKRTAVFPNPSSGLIYIRSAEPITSVAIYHLNGTLLKTLHSTDKELALNLTEFSSGVYILQLASGGQFIRERIVLNN